jgi:hypothetical protein
VAKTAMSGGLRPAASWLVPAAKNSRAFTGYYQWVPVWICFGVAVHFFPLASVLRNPTLRPLGVLLAAVAVAALVVGLASAVAPSTVTGLGAGLCLLAFGLATLLIGGPRQGNPGTRD